jgi:hypothetical protein
MFKKINVKMKLLSPLSHFGDERMGTMQLMRKHKFFYNGEFIDAPVFSGNAFRGILRRITMEDFLSRIDIKVKDVTEKTYKFYLNEDESNEEGISKKLYYSLFVGGALTSGTRFEEIGERQKMSVFCPPLAIFGTALGDRIPQGKLSSDVFKPVCKELAEYTGMESNISFYEMLEEVFYTRKDDLKSVNANIKAEEKADKKENATQMKYEMECLATGTELVGELILENYSDIELACLQNSLNIFSELGIIGGKSATGHGKVKVEVEQFSDSKLYLDYMGKNKNMIIEYIKELESVLK